MEVEVPPPAPATLPPRITTPTASTTTPVDPEEPEDPDAEPTFKTEKERECWQMFRKMADKGVAVSYDTVLRWGPVQLVALQNMTNNDPQILINNGQ